MRGGSGYKTPAWKIEAMRELWSSGARIRDIEIQLSIERTTIRRYCDDLRRPQRRIMTNQQRQELLRKWV